MVDFTNKELIIFDLDGTLINSIPDLTIAINKMLYHYDLPSISIEELTPFVGNGAKTLVKRALSFASKKDDIDANLLDKAFDYYFNAYKNNVCNETFLYPHVKETLSYLENKNYQMVICTNKPFDFVAPVLEGLNLKQYFTTWIGENSLPTKKPDAAPLLHLAKEMNKEISQCVMVGDSKNDILAAHNAGMDSIGVTYGYNYNEKIEDNNPTSVVDDFLTLQKLF